MKPGTYTTSRYRLNVKVQYDRVVAIDLGNGGTFHTGMNNEGYIYNGGTFSTNYSGFRRLGEERQRQSQIRLVAS